MATGGEPLRVSLAFTWPKWLEPKWPRGANPSARTSRLFRLGRGRWPDIGFPRLPACSHASLGAARHLDRCRAKALELAHSGHVMVSPPNLPVRVYAVYLQTNKNSSRFLSPFWLKHTLEHLGLRLNSFRMMIFSYRGRANSAADIPTFRVW